jgi:hypothetical protein
MTDEELAAAAIEACEMEGLDPATKFPWAVAKLAAQHRPF